MVRAIKCQEDGCLVQPSFNFPNKRKSIYCQQHAKDGMINVKKETFQQDGCLVRPGFNVVGEKRAIYCQIHTHKGMIDVKHKSCQHLIILVKNKEFFCSTCNTSVTTNKK